MAHYEEDYEYEPERKSHFWSKFLAVLLGFILGLICTLGGLAGLGYVLFAKIKIKDGFDTVNKITGSDIDYTEYITEEYAQKTVYGLLKDLNQLASDFQNGNASLSSLEKFSPMVRKTAEKLTEQMGEYGVVVDADVFLATPLSEMSTFFKDTVNDIEIGTMLDKAGMLEETNDSYSLLMALCYGEEGEDYTFDQEGNVVMLGDAKPTTFGSLTVDTNQVLDKVSLSAVMGTVDNSDPMIRALLYGAEGETYTYDEATNTVEMLPLSYKYDGAANTITDPDGVVYSYDETAERWIAENGNYISAQPVKAAQAAACALSDENDEQYAFIVYTSENEIVCNLKATATAGSYEAYDKSGKLIKHKPLSIGSLTSGNVTEVFEDMRLGDVLNVTPESDAILISLAYGSEGKDYVIENGKIVPITAPNTIGSLTDGDTSELFDKMELGAVLKVDPNDDLMCALAYGTKNKSYKVVEVGEGEFEIQMLPLVYTLKDGVLYDEKGVDANAELLENGIYRVPDGSTKNYYAKADKEGDTNFYLYEEEDCSGEKLLYEKTTLGDLMDGEGSHLLDDIELGTLMGLDGDSDSMLLALAYGSEGIDYAIDPETNTIVRIEGGKAPTTVGDLRDDEKASELLNGLKLADVLGVSPLDPDSDPVMVALAYGNEGADYTIENGEIVWAEGKAPRTIKDLKNGSEIIDEMYISTVLSLDAASDNAILMSIAYGNEGEDYEIVTNDDGTKEIVMKEGKSPRTVKDLKDKSTIDSVRLSAIITPDPEDKITMYILYGVEGQDYTVDENGNVVMIDGATPRTIGDLSGENSPISTITRDLTLGDVISIDEDDEKTSALLISLKDTPIDQLSAKINTLTLTEILGETDVEGNIYLKHLKDSTIKTLAKDLNDLTVQQVFADKIYKTEKTEEGETAVVYFVDKDGNRLYEKDGKYYTSPTFEADTESERVLQGTWKYLLTENGEEVEYKISEIDKLVTNMTANVQSATLEDLHKDGIITTDNTAFLETDILYKYVVGGTTIFEITPIQGENGPKEKIGELTITEMLDYVTKVLQALSNKQPNS